VKIWKRIHLHFVVHERRQPGMQAQLSLPNCSSTTSGSRDTKAIERVVNKVDMHRDGDAWMYSARRPHVYNKRPRLSEIAARLTLLNPSQC